MYRSSVDFVGGTADAPDYVYFNADIINNRTDDTDPTLQTRPDPAIRFNETRDTALVRDASLYHFSIIRFTMNGPSRDLPLLIPIIETGQSNVNLTTYAIADTLQQTWNLKAPIGNVALQITPSPTFLIYSPETQNPVLAPTPNPPIIEQDLKTRYYWVYTYSHWTDLVNQTMTNAHQALYTQFQNAWYAIAGNTTAFPYATFNDFVADVVPPKFLFNDDTQRYTILGDSDAFGERLEPFVPTAYAITAPAYNPALAYVFGDQVSQGGFVYTAIGPIAPATPPPNPLWIVEQPANSGVWSATLPYVVGNVVWYDGNLYYCWAPSPAGTLPTNVAFWAKISGGATAGQATKPTCRLFMNTNMFGLFANFNNYYYNTTTIAGFTNPVPIGYVNEILFTNKFYQNVVDYRLAPYSGAPPLGYVPIEYQKVYWANEQDYKSVDVLWTPISSIVFTSTLLPIKAEAVGAPIVFGDGNNTQSAPVSKSAFEPIITDIALPTGEANNYRSFIYYAPQAEYRLTDLGSSKQEIRNIDVQVFWKNRLDNLLYPITMFNLSNVSIKMMFRKKSLDGSKF